jgi:probable HAF family extracellular repeat protein
MTRRSSRVHRAFVTLAIIAASTTAALAEQYKIIDLGTLPGFSKSTATGVNGAGEVVGWSFDSSIAHAFLYRDGMMTDLGTLGQETSLAWAINEARQIVGDVRSYATGFMRAFLYSGGVMTDIGTLGGSYSSAYGLNNAGQVVGHARTGGNVAEHAFVFSGGVMTDLGVAAGFDDSYARDINEAGQVAGFMWNRAGSFYRPFLYSGGSWTNLIGLAGDRHFAYSVNDSGQVAGASYTLSTGGQLAWRWESGTLYDLGTLGGTNSAALAINNSGQIVGYSNVAGDLARHAFVFEGGVMKDLNDLISPISGLVLRAAQGINDAGQITVDGSIGGVNHAFLLTPAVLSSLALNPASVTGGQASLGTVTLSKPAPAGGLIVSLASSNTSVATVPASVTIAEGALSRSFTVKTKVTTTDTPVTISASFEDETKDATLTVKAPVLTALTLTPSTIAGCKAVTGKVKLSGKAPGGGITVTLSDSIPAATMPSSVTVPAGLVQASFGIATTPVSAVQTGTVTATYGGVTRNATLKVRPIGVLALSITPNPVNGGSSATGTVTLECPAAPGSITVQLSSTNPALATPTVSSVTIPAGSQTANFSVTTVKPSVASSATIKATANGISKAVKLTVNP